MHKQFQSAPLTDVRGDLKSLSFKCDLKTFQSAPLTDVRGDPAVDEKGKETKIGFNPLPSLM